MGRLPLSVSRYRRYTECPWQFKAVVLDKALMAPVDVLEMGILAHEVVQVYLEHCLKTEQPSAPQDVDAVWLEFVRTRQGGVPAGEAAGTLALLRRFATSHRFPLEQVWRPEAELAVTWDGRPTEWFAPDVFLRAKLDLALVDGWDATVHDWKSGWAVLASDQAAQDEIQFRTYAMVLNLWNPDIKRVTVVADFIRWGIQRRAIFDPQDFRDTWDFWRAASDNVEAALADLGSRKRWAPRPGPHCATCPVATRCPIPKAERDLVAITDPEDAQDVAAWLTTYDAQRAALTKSLKAWVDAHGPVDQAGLRYGYWKREGYEYPTHQVLRLAQEHDIDPGRVLRVSREDLKRARKINGAFVDAVEALAVDKSGTEFRAKKVTGDDAE